MLLGANFSNGSDADRARAWPSLAACPRGADRIRPHRAQLASQPPPATPGPPTVASPLVLQELQPSYKLSVSPRAQLGDSPGGFRLQPLGLAASIALADGGLDASASMPFLVADRSDGQAVGPPWLSALARSGRSGSDVPGPLGAAAQSLAAAKAAASRASELADADAIASGAEFDAELAANRTAPPMGSRWIDGSVWAGAAPPLPVSSTAEASDTDTADTADTANRFSSAPAAPSPPMHASLARLSPDAATGPDMGPVPGTRPDTAAGVDSGSHYGTLAKPHPTLAPSAVSAMVLAPSDSVVSTSSTRKSVGSDTSGQTLHATASSGTTGDTEVAAVAAEPLAQADNLMYQIDMVRRRARASRSQTRVAADHTT